MKKPGIKKLWQTVGERCRERREELGLTQDYLGTAIGLNRTSISNLEVGRQRLPVTRLVMLARELDTTAAELLEGY